MESTEAQHNSETASQEILKRLDEISETRSDEIRHTSDEREFEIELGGRADFFALRKRWSMYLFWFLAATLVFQFFIAISIGLGLLKYVSGTVTAILLSESFVQIVGLVFLVVKFLFSTGDK